MWTGRSCKKYKKARSTRYVELGNYDILVANANNSHHRAEINVTYVKYLVFKKQLTATATCSQ
jgi:hypothetical protein